MIRRSVPLAAVLLIAAFTLVAVTLADLLGNGPFTWHFTQDTTIQGALELLALCALLFGALSMRGQRTRMAFVALLVFAYLRRHHADASAASSWFQLELLLAAGAAMLRLLRMDLPKVDGDAYLRLFVVGLGVLATLYLFSSVLGNGRARDLRALAVLIAIVVFPYARLRPLGWHAMQRIGAFEPGLRAIAAVLVAWLAASYARVANVLGYDSAWYGLRGDLVLAPVRSLFDETGLVSPVYYFPKLYELLLLPLNGIGTYTHAMALAGAMLVILALACWRIARAFGATEREAGWALLLVMSLPVVANHAMTTKPDLLTVALMLIAVRLVLAFARDASRADGLLALAALALAVQAKLSSGPFCAAIGLVLLVVAWQTRSAPAPGSMRVGLVGLVLAILVTAALTARTLLLAGVPTIGPDPLLHLWLELGFVLREPVGTLDWLHEQDWGDVPALARDFVIAPSALPHIIVMWTGNSWLWCLALVCVAGGAWRALRARPYAAALLASCGACGIWLALGQGYMLRGGDGNYFMLAPVLALVALVPMALRRWPGAMPPIALALFAALQFSYSFVSAAWGVPGTHTWDLDFTRGPDRASVLRHGLWEANGMLELAEAVRREPRTLHLVGDIPEFEGFLLPVRFEPLPHMYYSHIEQFDSVDSLQELLDAAKVDALVAPAPGTEDRTQPFLPIVLDLVARWRADPTVKRVPAGRFELLLRPPREG